MGRRRALAGEYLAEARGAKGVRPGSVTMGRVTVSLHPAGHLLATTHQIVYYKE